MQLFAQADSICIDTFDIEAHKNVYHTTGELWECMRNLEKRQLRQKRR